MTTIINGSSPSITFSDNTTQTTAGLPLTGGTITGNVTTAGLTIGTTPIGAGNATRFKNRIINGDMRIDQRNAGASVTPTTNSTYTLDRWRCGLTQSSKFSVQQTTTAPTGFINSLKVTSTSAYTLGAGDIFLMSQFIEGLNVSDLGWGTANAKTITLSFQVYSSLTGTFGGALGNSAANRSYPFTYTISSANTWTSISVTIAGDTSGTWLTTNGTGIAVYLGLGVGTTYSGTAGSWAGAEYYSATGATSVVSTNGATFYITGVQLEVGSSATGFEYVDYTAQLLMCQRYYIKFTCPASTVFMMGIINVTTNVYGGSLTLPATMRTTPTLAQASLRCYDASASNVITAIASNQSSKEVVSAEFTTSGMTVGRSGVISGNDNSSAFISASAEL